MRVRKPFILRIPIQITEQRTDEVVLDLRFGRVFKCRFMGAEVIHEFLDFQAGFFFGEGHNHSQVNGLILPLVA
jgi:hypothetical protein